MTPLTERPAHFFIRPQKNRDGLAQVLDQRGIVNGLTRNQFTPDEGCAQLAVKLGAHRK